jgi:hypothetical protein
MLNQIRKYLTSLLFVALRAVLSKDESMVALALILGVPLSDVLYMNGAKGAGRFDDGLFNKKCTWVAPSFISPGMEE